MLNILLDKGADPNYENESKTPLLHAMHNNQVEVVHVLQGVTKK